MIVKINRRKSKQHQNFTHSKQRIYLNRETVDSLEDQILISRHLERYALVRQFLYGKVLDIACGVGYGSYLLAKNPDVKQNKKTTHYNEFHRWDITSADVFDMFSNFVCINQIRHCDSTILHLIRRRAETMRPKRLK